MPEMTRKVLMKQPSAPAPQWKPRLTNADRCRLYRAKLKLDRVGQTEVDPSVYICYFCKQPFARDYSVLTHIEKEHWRPSLNPKEYFHTIPLNEVIRTATRKSMNTNGKRKSNSGTVLECLACKKSMSKTEACRHVRTDRTTGSLTCEVQCPDGRRLSPTQRPLLFSSHVGHLCQHCGSVFANRTTLDVHLVRVHGQTTELSLRFPCPICGYVCASAHALQLHQATHRASPDLMHICDVCGRAFKSSPILRTHRNRTHRAQRHACQYCPKTYSSRAAWKVHTQQHLGESPFQCNVCHQGFCSRYSLTVHSRQHTGERPFTCNLCPATFLQQSSLTLHIKKHHPPDQSGQSHREDKEGKAQEEQVG